MKTPKYIVVADTYRPRPDNRPLLRDPDEVAALCRPLVTRSREHLLVLCVDAHTRLIARETVAVGSLNVARATPRDVFVPALKRDAAGVLLVHNHPSGCAEPSADDIQFTRSVLRAGEFLGIPCWDHVVVAQDGHVSIRARGVIQAWAS